MTPKEQTLREALAAAMPMAREVYNALRQYISHTSTCSFDETGSCNCHVRGKQKYILEEITRVETLTKKLLEDTKDDTARTT